MKPGKDTFYIIGRSVSQGRRSGIVSALGISTGSLVYTVLAAFGLSVILAKSILLFIIVKVIGAIYLVYLGMELLVRKSKLTENVTIW